MSAKRLTMRKVREILRLRFDLRFTLTRIATSCNIGRSTVFDHLERFKASGLNWPLPDEVDDNRLEQLLFPAVDKAEIRNRSSPDWSVVHQELRRKSVTLMLLWQEYKERHPDGHQYSQFCHLYRQWAGQIDPVMRQTHPPGENLFVDYAGQTVDIHDPASKDIRPAQIFVAVLGASNYTFAEATWSQALPDWIGSHVRAFEYFGGVTAVVVPDNLKSGVKDPCFYDPDINPTYLDMARHYGMVVLPARKRKARDKAKVEEAVQLVERWILARLRNQKFFSLHQLNQAIQRLLEELNRKPFQKLPGTRLSQFQTVDRPALKPLPAQPYSFAEWKKARVNIDYHIEVQRHYYSVPHTLIKKQIDVRITDTTIECFYQSKRVASHIRSYKQGQHTTVKEHMPPSHQQWAEWSPERFIRWAEKIGPQTTDLIRTVLSSRPHPQQGYRGSMGILRLGESYGHARLEAACDRANRIGGTSYKSVASILKHGLDQQPPAAADQKRPTVIHANIRGSQYYQ
jgi:transposase